MEATLRGTEEQQRLARWIFNLLMIQGSAYGTRQPIEVTLDDLVNYFRRQPGLDGEPKVVAQKIEEAVGENLHIFRRFTEGHTVVYAVTKEVQLSVPEPPRPEPEPEPALPEPEPAPAPAPPPKAAPEPAKAPAPEKPARPAILSWSAEKQKIVKRLESLGLTVSRSGGDYLVNDRVVLTMLSSGLQGHWYWFGLHTRFGSLVKEYPASFLLLLCDSAETVLVVPGEMVEEWVRDLAVRHDRYHIHVTYEEGRYKVPELDNRDVTEMLNDYDAIAHAAKGGQPL